MKVIGILGEELIDLLLSKKDVTWIQEKLYELKGRLVDKYGEILVVTRNNIGVESLVHSVFDKISIVNPLYYDSDYEFHITGDYSFIANFCDFTIVFTHNPNGNSQLQYLLDNSDCLWVNYATKREKWLKNRLEY